LKILNIDDYSYLYTVEIACPASPPPAHIGFMDFPLLETTPRIWLGTQLFQWRSERQWLSGFAKRKTSNPRPGSFWNSEIRTALRRSLLHSHTANVRQSGPETEAQAASRAAATGFHRQATSTEVCSAACLCLNYSAPFNEIVR
jgi:hypothetical protein